MISNLKETGEFLTLEADAHPSSDKADVASRERAALDHWQDLLEKHKTKCAAVEELQVSLDLLLRKVIIMCFNLLLRYVILYHMF